MVEIHNETSSKGKEKAKDDSNPFKKQLGDTSVALDREKLQQAIMEEKKRKKGELEDDAGDKRRKFNSSATGNHDVTEEELGAWWFSTCLMGTDFYFSGRGLSNAALELRRSYGQLQGHRNLVDGSRSSNHLFTCIPCLVVCLCHVPASICNHDIVFHTRSP